jgi:hypothetical protein
MKRSEMIALMIKELPFVKEKKMEKLLDLIEKQGMLPPKHYNVPDEEQEEPTQRGYHGLNGWEPE